MNTPIVVLEGEDILVFSSVKDAEQAVEGVDVENGEYEFFDADGRELRASVTRTPKGCAVFGSLRPSVARVSLSYHVSREPGIDRLREALAAWVRRHGYPGDTSSMSMRELIEAVTTRVGYSR